MHRLFLVAFVALFLIIPAGVLAADIAYIVKNPSNPETQVISAIQDLGYSYDLIDDNNLPSINFSDYEMILVWDELLTNTDKIPITQKKSLVANTYYLKDWKIAEYSGSQISTGYLKTRILLNNRITRNLVSPIQVYGSTNIVLSYLPYSNKRATGLKNVVSTDNYNEYPIIGIINPGGKLYKEGNAKERIAFFGITESDHWTQNSEQLFKNTLEWVIGGDDADLDGFYYDEDCNDQNANINPSAEEIPYNGIDEDCDGYDLEDVDKDGFKAEEAGGDDCDDSDPSINPGPTDIYKNCANDAPFVETIGKITAYETETITIEAIAEDAENDSLTYSINDSRFQQDENIFTWNTGYYDAGIYRFTITVSDSFSETELEIEIEIKETNQIPVCIEIPELQWDEDTSSSLNIKDYCSDADGDSINFYAYNSSFDSHIILTDLESGIAEFSSETNWNGEDWIVFKVSDGKDYSLTNKIILKVLPVNDAPKFIDNPGKINDITWNEDTNLIDYLDLDYYFSDVDGDVLEYDVIGNHFITIEIENGIASFYPDKNWYGTENVVFSAFDGYLITYSNAIKLKVLDLNEPPEFQDMNCSTEINEDTEESCKLNAADFEGDSFKFVIVNENNLQCEIVENSLNYISNKDYNGQASCLIRVQDNYGYSDYLLEVNVLPVNDAPKITASPSASNIKILEGKTQLFSVAVSDVENDPIVITWKINEENIGTGNSYLFNQSLGNYNLGVVASDGIAESNHLWNILVGSELDFTCSESGGLICGGGGEICSGNTFKSSDTSSCCSTICVPKFSDVDRCESISSEIEITIQDPDNSEKFDIGETINIEVKIKNKAEDDLDFDTEVYLYDLTEDEIIEEDDDSVSVDENDNEKISFQLTIPEDTDERNNYAIFVVADEGDYCGEDYVKININREKEKIIIKEINLESGLVCGDYADLGIKVKNIGTRDQDVTLSVGNPEIGIKEVQEFELEKYDEKDEATKDFKIKIPDDAAAGTYNLKITAEFNGESTEQETELILGKCKQEEKKEEKIETISLGSETKSMEEKVEEKQNTGSGLLIALVITMVVVIVAIIFLVYMLLASSWNRRT